MAAQGYRTVPHTADLRIEAWAESRDECVAEALRGLIASFADISDVQPARVLERLMTAGSDADLLASAADEVIYILDVEGEVKRGLQVRDLVTKFYEASGTELAEDRLLLAP